MKKYFIVIIYCLVSVQLMFGQNSFPTWGLAVLAQDGGQLKLTGGSVDAGVWTSNGSMNFANWNDATKGLNVNLSNGKVGIGTLSPQSRLNINQGAGDTNVGTPVLTIGGTNNYPSLEFGIKGAYDGQISTYGNDLHIYAGNWRYNGATATENHSISFYTSQASSTNWNTAKMILKHDGNVGIGTTTPDSKLTVKGTIHTQEVKVDLNGSVAPDYVFEKDYPLTSLEELKSYIEHNKHLPEVPSAKKMEEEGINLKEMNLLLLKKVEELTLHVIQLQNQINSNTGDLKELKAPANQNKNEK